jgi:hypothetical protein
MGSADQNVTLIKEGSANTHLTHLEELVLTQGPQGYEMARSFLLELLETLKGNSNASIQTSVKWDGAPAIFAGINPENGKFFVGTKSIFNKVPKINYTEEDVIKNHGHAPGLVDKLTKALKYLPQLGITNILQGDFMFDDEMLDVVEIDGEPHYRFKPNTIVYAVPVNSDIGREIGQSKFGIVFHTTYSNLDGGATFGADVSTLNRAPGVWFDDAFFTDDTGTVTLTENEERRIVSLVEKADAVNERINYNDLPMAMLNIYINSEIKSGQFIENPESSLEGFVNWYTTRSDAAIDKLKTSKGQERKRDQQQQTLQTFEGKREDILNLFRVSRLLFEAKNIFIEKYNNAVYNTKHFVDDGSGDLVATNPEGYVAVDHAGNGVKFVDRLEFSRANFLVDKSAKFVQENLSKFTIQVSKDKQVTKTIGEWLEEIKNANHTYQKPPQLVYKDILAGTPIVEIVSQENAEKTIYNAVITYVNNLREEDESEDPVVDEEFTGRTIALVPGSMKPPTIGHVGMIERYSEMVAKRPNGSVFVFVSNPTAIFKKGKKKGQLKSARGFPGREQGISQDEAVELLKRMLPKDMLAPVGNVEIRKTSHASPMSPVYDFVSPKNIKDIEQARSGDIIILGSSTKGGDADRWNDIINNQNERVRPGVTVNNMPVDPIIHSSSELGLSYLKYLNSAEGNEILNSLPTLLKAREKDPDLDIEDIDLENISASDARYLMGFLHKGVPAPQYTAARRLIKAFFGEDSEEILKSIGYEFETEIEKPEELDETSGAGAAGGFSGNIVPVKSSRSEKPGNRKKKIETQKEIIDTSLIDNVMRLIMERGILR